MTGRNGNAKARARRIDREYFKRVFPIARWRWYLALILTAAGAGWIAWRALALDQTAFSSGPLTPHHATFGENCGVCHLRRNALTTAITNEACTACHDGPIHKEQQTWTPDCVECHIEHRGTAQLLGAAANTCVRCHRDLKTKSGKITVAAHIDSLAEGHPEFTPLRAADLDPGGIKFNHKVHLKKDLKAPQGMVQLDCSDCHRPTGITQPWPYGSAAPPDTGTTLSQVPPRSRLSARAYMQPVNYYSHCSACHPLIADTRISRRVPHKKPEVVAAFLERQFLGYIETHPEELRSVPFWQRIPRSPGPRPPRTPEEWVRMRVAEAERRLSHDPCDRPGGRFGGEGRPALDRRTLPSKSA
jgi:predicted CXXCH cytochrome family protein